jgi:predicted house-cleaning noncanonical NTP pyrophosphatase (MazG superfamily)
MVHSKLVRDKIPQIILAQKRQPIYHVATEKEYGEYLMKKLQEEVNEFFEAENKEELADVMEVIYAICQHKQFDLSDIEKVRMKKKEERGAFNDRLILDQIIEVNP